MQPRVLALLGAQQRRDREGDDGGGDEGNAEGVDAVGVVAQPAQKKGKQGREAITAANAPSGHAKQIFIPDPKDANRMLCILCRERHPKDEKRWSVGMPAGKGQTHASQHAWHEHQITFGKTTDPKQRRFIMDFPRPSDEMLDEAFLNELIQDLQPFSFINRPGRMQVAALTLPAGYTPPSNVTLKTQLHDAFTTARSLLRSTFRSPKRGFVDYYSVSFDGWKAALKAKVMYAAKVHFINEDGVALCFPLDVSAIADKRAVTVARWLHHALENAGLDPLRLYCLTGDGAERKVGEDFSDERAEEIPVDDDVNWEEVAQQLKVLYVWCGDHRLSLVVKKTLKLVQLVHTVVEPTEQVVQFVRKTPKIRALYEKFREEAKIGQVIKTFPATCYAMAVQLGRRFLANSEILSRVKSVCIDTGDAPFNAFPDVNMSKLKSIWSDILLILEPLDSIISLWSSSTVTPRSGRFYLEIFFLDARARSAGPFASPQGGHLRDAALASIEEYFGDRKTNSALVLAAAFTPQVLLDSNWPGNDGKRLRDDLLLHARSLLEAQFRVRFPERWNELMMQTTRRTGRAFSFTDSSLYSQWSAYRTLLSLQDGISLQTDALEWWYAQRGTFPDLFQFVRLVHSVPMSSSDIERLWSKLKRVLTKVRGALDVETGAEQVWCNEFRAAERRLDEMWTKGKLGRLGARPQIEKNGKSEVAKFDLATYLKSFE
jgi:hypothetical protein